MLDYIIKMLHFSLKLLARAWALETYVDETHFSFLVNEQCGGLRVEVDHLVTQLGADILVIRTAAKEERKSQAKALLIQG